MIEPLIIELFGTTICIIMPKGRDGRTIIQAHPKELLNTFSSGYALPSQIGIYPLLTDVTHQISPLI